MKSVVVLGETVAGNDELGLELELVIDLIPILVMKHVDPRIWIDCKWGARKIVDLVAIQQSLVEEQLEMDLEVGMRVFGIVKG